MAHFIRVRCTLNREAGGLRIEPLSIPIDPLTVFTPHRILDFWKLLNRKDALRVSSAEPVEVRVYEPAFLKFIAEGEASC